MNNSEPADSDSLQQKIHQVLNKDPELSTLKSRRFIATSLKHTRRWRFGLGVSLLGIFTLGVTLLLPPKDHLFWASVAACVFFIGIWQIDRANHPKGKDQTNERNDD